MNSKNGISWVIAGYAVLALNTLMSDKSWSPKTAISAGIAALGVGAMGNTTLSLRFGQLYFLAVILTHGLELVEDLGDAPDKLPSSNSSGKGSGKGSKDDPDNTDSDEDDNGGNGNDDSGGSGSGDGNGAGPGGGTKSPYIDPRNV